MNILRTIGAVIRLTAPVAMSVVNPSQLINVAAGMVLKHFSSLPNRTIPFLNLLVSSAASYAHHIASGVGVTQSILPALQEGGLLAAGSTFIHQSLKIPLGELITGPIAQKVGPGDKFSI